MFILKPAVLICALAMIESNRGFGSNGYSLAG